MQSLAVKNRGKFLDCLFKFRKFCFERVFFKPRQTTKFHFKDCLCLSFGESESLTHSLRRNRRRFRRLDDFDDFVDIVDCDEQSFHDFRADFRLFQVKIAAFYKHVALEVDVMHQHFDKSELFGLAFRDRHHIDIEVCFKFGMCKKIIYDFLRVGVLTHLNYGAHTVSVGLVHDVRNTAEYVFFRFAKLQYFLQQVGFFNLIRQFRNNDVFLFVFAVFDVDSRAQSDFALARRVRLHKVVPRDNYAARRKVGAGDDFHKFVKFDFGIIDNRNRAVDDFADIVSRDIRRKTDRYAVCAVHEKVGESARQKHRLFHRIVEVPLPWYGILFQVFQDFHRKGIQAGFGVTHCRRAVAVDTAEVAVAVDQHFSHIERLRHSDHSVVNGRVAVGVEFAQTFADDTRRLLMRFVRGVSEFVHSVKDTALHGFKTVFDARNGAVKDNVFAVRHHRSVHDFFDGHFEKLRFVFNFRLFLCHYPFTTLSK